MTTDRGHITVLLKEAVQHLIVDTDGTYLDGTYGRGGHCGLILDTVSESAKLIALDQDADAIADGQQRFAQDSRLLLIQKNFVEMESLLQRMDLVGKVDGVLLDLGVSSVQLDTAERGFSFQHDGLLDMRMDRDSGESAEAWLSVVSTDDLAVVLRDYGEERYAKRIAAAIVAAREKQALTSTLQLAEVIKQAHPNWDHRRHPATRSFQAIRIHINNELGKLQKVLEQMPRILKPGGRLVVISFHSLEDRVVKKFLKGSNPFKDLPRHLPIPAQAEAPMKAVTRVLPSAQEIASNPRARSAVMRVGVRRE